jgi:hypothetical protein
MLLQERFPHASLVGAFPHWLPPSAHVFVTVTCVTFCVRLTEIFAAAHLWKLINLPFKSALTRPIDASGSSRVKVTLLNPRTIHANFQGVERIGNQLDRTRNSHPVLCYLDVSLAEKGTMKEFNGPRFSFTKESSKYLYDS